MARDDAREALLEDLTVQAVPAIADRYASDADLLDVIWQRLLALRGVDRGPVERALWMNSRLAVGVDTPHIVRTYVELIGEPEAAQKHDIVYYRLEDLARPRQLLGWSLAPDEHVLEMIRRDACVGSSMEGRWETRELRLKLLAWDTLLSLGRRDVPALLGPAVASETNGFALGEIFGVAACTEVGALPPDVPGLIAGTSDRVPDEENQRLIAQIGAIGVAHAARTREAFDALLGYEPIGSKGVLISLIDALADCAAARIAAGDGDAEQLLWLAMRRGGASTRHAAAAAVLARLIRQGVSRPPGVDDLIAAIGDEALDAYARRELIDAAGYLDAAPPDQRLASALRTIALGAARAAQPGPEEGGWPDLPPVALGALARLGILAADPDLLGGALGLTRGVDGWGLAATAGWARGASFVVGLLYAADPDAFAPAVAGLIDAGDWASLSRLRPHLGRGPMPTPPAVVEALVRRIRRVQSGRMTEPELFALLARLDPGRLASEPWDGWEDWPPQARAAFADAIATACSPGHTERCMEK